MNKINLSDIIKNDTKVISGRENGQKARKKYKLDIEDLNIDPVEIHIPNDIFSVTSSFILGMFGPSIRRFLKEGFYKKYVFVCDNTIKENIDIGIQDALRRGYGIDEK